MIVLYKKRNFSDYFSDTISFFRTYGRHFFLNYFIINGLFLMILAFLIYFITKIYFEAILSGISNPQGNNPNALFDYFYANSLLFGGLLAGIILVTVFLSLLNFTYPIAYMQLTERYGDKGFGKKEIITALKQELGRLFLFFLGFLFVIVPILILLFVILFAAAFIIIGIPLLFIAGPAAISWIALSYQDYLIRKSGFFGAFRNGFGMLRQKFWTVIGTTFLIILIIQILQGIITMIPYIIGLVLLMTSTQNFSTGGNPNDYFSIMSIYIAAMMVFAVILSYFFNNFLVVAQGFIYYSMREENENNFTKGQIEAIGTDFE